LTEDSKKPVSLYLPESLIERIDEKRGRLSRSLYMTLLLERLPPMELKNVA
jgi:hypothetical protein